MFESVLVRELVRVGIAFPHPKKSISILWWKHSAIQQILFFYFKIL